MKRLAIFAILAILAIFAISSSSANIPKTRYDNHKVVRAYLNREQISQLEQYDLDIWSDALSLGFNDIRVSPEQLTLLDRLNITYQIFIANVQDLIDQEERSLAAAPAAFFDTYQRYSAIVAYLQLLSQTYRQITTFVPSIGTTVEGRNIPALLISVELGKNISAAAKNTIFITGGQHAREWIAPATVLYILTELLGQYGTNSKITTIINEFNYVFIPLVNPDGYEFAFTTTRLWRKNRKNNGNGVYGVDLNRNWDYKWGGAGSSATPSSDTYRGTSAFSEPESRAVSNYFSKTGSIVGAIDYHSYSQLILRPWGDTTTNPPNNANLMELGTRIRSAILGAPGVAYTSQKSIDLYATTGSASDWYMVNTVSYSKYAYTIELRDTGRNGFVLPVSEILPTGIENLAGFIEFATYIRSKLIQ
eukprot:TRINITY_DN7348_c0_g1_i3.p1 TRINITY_DN7348_c0_g1~~TRINITY_DN7348_c0_g1_i3.p1  ORF type:complete len:453 (-),score=96.70 TRINITY_DN7348_c0_g1_i3:111-1370(-)